MAYRPDGAVFSGDEPNRSACVGLPPVQICMRIKLWTPSCLQKEKKVCSSVMQLLESIDKRFPACMQGNCTAA
jgi:hypothetical protein